MIKRIISILVLCMIFFTGCGKKELDLEKIAKELEVLATDKLDILKVSELIDKEESLDFDDLEDITINELKQELNLDYEELERYVFRINKNTKDMYMIVLPKEDKCEEVKNKIKEYFKKVEDSSEETFKDKIQNRLEKEYQEYQVYIVSNDNDRIFNIIKNSNTLIFGNLINVEDESLGEEFGINPDDIEEYVVKKPILTIQANSYFIIKPKDDKYDIVKSTMDNYMKNAEEQWANYLPEQYQLLKSRLESVYGKYLIYIISIDNSKVLKTIEANKK